MLRIAILLVLLSVPLRANLGETVAQCVARYGRPNGYAEAKPNFPFGTMVFRAGGFDLIVFLSNNVEVGARVSKSDKSVLNDVEMQNIMSADAGPGAWTSTPSSDPDNLTWVRPDKSTVTYDKVKHILIFATPEMTAMVGAKH